MKNPIELKPTKYVLLSSNNQNMPHKQDVKKKNKVKIDEGKIKITITFEWDGGGAGVYKYSIWFCIFYW